MKDKEFIELKDIAQLEPLSGFRVKFIHSSNMTFAYWKIKANAVLPEHHHVHEQVAMVTKGELELTISGTTRIVRPGTIAVIPSGAVHSGKAITACEVTDVFYPVREDYRNK